MGRLVGQFEAFYNAVRADIFNLCTAMNFEPTWQQAQALKLVQYETTQPLEKRLKRVAVKSGQGPGKTAVECIIGIYRALLDVDAMVVVTAPTQRQLTDVWIGELRRRIQQAEPIIQQMFEISALKSEIFGRPMWGIRTRSASRPENFQGYHQEYLTFILDEASGIASPIWDTIKGTLTNPNSLLVACGNPNTRECDFFNCFNRDRHLWHTVTWNAEETSRDYPWMLDPENLRKLEEEYGKDSDVYRVRVLGEFPYMDPNCVISSEDLEACTRTDIYECARIGAAKQFGIDLARFGSDESTIYRRVGNSIVEWDYFSKVDPNTVVEHAFRMQANADWRNLDCIYVPDAGGMGQGVMRRFYDAKKQVFEFHNGGRASKPDYANKITEAWFEFAKLVKARKCHIPNDNRLIQQCATRQYKVNKKGKLELESKEEYCKRNEVSEGSASPDRADGIVLAFYDRIAIPGQIVSAHSDYRIGDSVRG